MNGKVVNKKSGERYDLYVGRPTILGNPFSHNDVPGTIKVESRERAVRLYRYYAIVRMDLDPKFRRAIKMCKGRTIACWCAPEACHAEVILELANAS